MKRLASHFLLVLAIAWGVPVMALQWGDDFSTSQNLDFADLVWNLPLQKLHPPILVKGWDDGGGVKNTPLDVGDGSDGVFDSSTYSHYSENGDLSGQIIRLNTNTYSSLQFTSFSLDAGWTLLPTGVNPLVIRVQGDVVINGIIDCSGDAGGDISADKTQVALGGDGRCGGANGGNGGSDSMSPTGGSAGGLNITGGGAGPSGVATGGQGGGGGGGYTKTGVSEDATAGDDSIGGNGGAVGTQFRDDGFLIVASSGGSGGGGGSAFTDLGDVANHSSGGAGGAGGGVIYIVSAGGVTIGAAGSVRALGGAGGGTAGTLKAGGGGGGAGGSISIFAAGDIQISGSISAIHGLGGVSNGGDGGRGSYGRTWIQDKDVPTGSLETPVTQLNVPGEIKFEISVPYTVTSTAIDLLNTQPEVTAASIAVANPSNGTSQLELAFAESGDASAFTSWQVAASYVSAGAQKRYLKYRIQMTNTDDSSPISMSGLTVEYNGFRQDDFAFTTGCGRVANSTSYPYKIWSFWLIIVPALMLFGLRRRNANS